MNFEPFDTNVIVRRLQAQAQGLHLVGSAADYAAVKELRSFRTPSAFVVFADEENTGRLPTTFCTTQVETTVQFGVVLALRNYQEQLGGQMSDEARKAEVIANARAAAIEAGFPDGLTAALFEMLVEGSIAHEYEAFDAR